MKQRFHTSQREYRRSNEDYRKKLRRVVVWIKNNIDDSSSIGASSLRDVRTWIDVACAVHPNMRSHNVGAMSFGTGPIDSNLSKQKLNTKILAEAELVGMSEYLPYNRWLTMFLEERRYNIKDNIIYQDDQGAIRTEKQWKKLIYWEFSTY